MHFHMPKPIHGWREFFGEVGIIVVGVLIALSAEQILERLHWREKVAQANDQLNLELQSDSLSAYELLAVRGCLQAQLNAAENAVLIGRDTGEIPPVPAYAPPLVLFTSDAWLNARSLQVADHMGPEAMRDYALVYFFPRELEGNVVQLHQLAAELRPLKTGLRRVSPEEAGTYQRLISKARELQERTSLASILLVKRAGALGITLAKADTDQALAGARAAHGACVTPPAMDKIIQEMGSDS